MAVYYFGGCESEIPDHICNPCETQESGRIRSVAFILKSFTFTNPANPTEWNAGIANRSIFIIPEVTGSADGGTPVTGPGYGDQSTKQLGIDFTANFRDPNYTQNADFYDGLKNSRAYKFAYRTGSQIHISDNSVSISPKNPVTEEINSDVTWDVDVAWSQKSVMRPYDTPNGVFDECFSVAP